MQRKFVLYSIITLILIVPGALYFVLVDFGVWDMSEHWAELGTALGGMYTPLLTLLMIFVIFRQTKIIETQTIISNSMLNTTIIANRNILLKDEFDSYEKQIDILSSKISPELEDTEVINQLIAFKKAKGNPLALIGIDTRKIYELVYSWSSIDFVLSNIDRLEKNEVSINSTYNLRNLLTSKLGYENCRLLDTCMRIIDKQTNFEKNSYYYL